jgi:hypothetical protein
VTAHSKEHGGVAPRRKDHGRDVVSHRNYDAGLSPQPTQS